MRAFVTAVLISAATASPVAQDPVATLPGAYRLVFENEWVKVTRVHYAPNVKLPAHAHTALASAYVYLNDSGPILFRHIGADYGAATRPPTTAGSFRLFRGITEVHEVENLSTLASDFLRVEFKTDPVDPRTLRGKFQPAPAAGLVNEQFANQQLRATRIVLPPGASVELTGDANPSVLILLSEPEMGEVRWLSKGHHEWLRNPTLTPVEALRFELRTEPQR